MDLRINWCGCIRCIYGEAIDLTVFGVPSIRRASYVEPDKAGLWWSDLSPAGGPQLGPFGRRSQALDAELAWLETFWLASPNQAVSISQ